MVVLWHEVKEEYGPAVAPPTQAHFATTVITREGKIRFNGSVGEFAARIDLSGGITYGPATAVSALEIYDAQAYFWTKGWQDDEAQVDIDYATGHFYEPKDARDLIRWLREG